MLREDVVDEVPIDNLITLTDTYKVTQWKQYPPGTERVYSYFESRGGNSHEILFFGLQAMIERRLEGAVITQRMIDFAEEFLAAHHNRNASIFNRQGWEHILDAHNGRLPIRIKAVKEGSVVPVSNVLITVENTDPKCFWLTNYIEALVVQTWYPTTVATLSMNMRNNFLWYLDKTGTPSSIDFKLHDFGVRGTSSMESAMIGGSAHLVVFRGTDNLPALMFSRRYYDSQMAGYSIPAAEHSTIISWGKERETDALANMLDQFPNGMVAVVSDSYDIYNACKNIWGGKLKEKVISRDGVLVVRPDSGYPPDVIVRVLDILGEKFGYTWNDKSCKVLNGKIRVIQGDGLDLVMSDKILDAMMESGWSADNVTFGMGGGLLQKVDRDTHKFALKCSNVLVDGKSLDVSKDPITDRGKRSKMGMLKLIELDGKYTTVGQSAEGKDLLEDVFENGKLLRRQSLDEIREIALSHIKARSKIIG